MHFDTDSGALEVPELGGSVVPGSLASFLGSELGRVATPVPDSGPRRKYSLPVVRSGRFEAYLLVRFYDDVLMEIIADSHPEASDTRSWAFSDHEAWVSEFGGAPGSQEWGTCADVYHDELRLSALFSRYYQPQGST